MNKYAKSLVAASVAAAALGSGVAVAEVSANVGVASNYLWRGVTQTGDDSAISGGIDYAGESGFYVGTWTSSLGGGDYELDLYAGFGGEAGDFGYDVGVITYQYPISESHFNEVYLNGSAGIFNAGLAYTIGSDDDDTPEFSQGDLYVYAGLATETAGGLGIGATVGSYNFDDDAGEDYVHFNVSVSKDDFTFAVDKNDIDGLDEPRISVAWSKAFDL